jgi:DNA-binding GntR family transcriptional regulator
MPRPEPKQTRGSAIGAMLRDDILNGRYRPGDRLMFPGLCKRYGASVGVTREALASLAAEGLVQTEAHQGYVVRPLSPEDLTELTAARVSLEPIVLRQSIVHGNVGWESRVVAAHHVLMRTPREQEDDPLRITNEWAEAHEAFHAALFSGCENNRLLAITQMLATEAALYRRWSPPFESNRDVAAEHAALVEATIERDADKAADLLIAHIAHTAQLLITHSHEIGPAASDDAQPA